MNKNELIEKVADNMNSTKVQASHFVNATFAAMCEALASGEEVSVAGFGKFETRERAARTGRNPQTGEEIEIAASKNVAFKAAKGLKESVKEL